MFAEAAFVSEVLIAFADVSILMGTVPVTVVSIAE
jgi:hypothetical protein